MKRDIVNAGKIAVLRARSDGLSCLPVEYFIELIDCIDDFVFMADDELNIVTANRAARLQTGYTDRDLDSRRLGDLIEARERRRFVAILKTLKTRFGGETALKLSSGATLRVEYSVSRLSATKGECEGFLLICRPLVGRLGSEGISGTCRLRKRIIENIAEPLLIISFPACVICERNRCVELLTGYNRSELIGKSIFDFLEIGGDRDGRSAVIDRVNEDYAGRGYSQNTVYMPRKSGPPIPCDCFSVPFFRDSGHVDYTMLALIDRSDEMERRSLLSAYAEKAELLAADLEALAGGAKAQARGRPLSARGFTPRQIEIARLVFEGRPSKEIAYLLGISESTVKNHLAAMFKKLGAKSRVDFLHRLVEDRIWIA